MLSIWLLRFEDVLRTRNAAALVALAKLPTALLALSRPARLTASVAVATHYPGTPLGRMLLSRALRLSRAVVSRAAPANRVSLSRSAIIKPCSGVREPGFLLVSFESELARLVTLESFKAFEADYRIVFLPTWQPFYSEAMCLLEARSSQEYFVMPSAFSEERLCSAFSPQCNFLPFHAASWVRSDLYGPPAVAKQIDVLMLANFSRHKRHWRLFEALGDLPHKLRVVLAGVPLGTRSKDSLLREARLFGVEDRVRIVESATDGELRGLLSSARLLCAMSHKEGSYIAVAEALMAGVPVSMFDSAKIGSKPYITDRTGFLLKSDRPLGPQLKTILERLDGLNPQPWARTTISAEANCKKLNVLLKRWALKRHLEWTRDIEPFFCQHFEFLYFRDRAEKEMAAEYLRLRESFGLNIVRT